VTVAPVGEKINQPKEMPKGAPGKTEVRIITPSGTMPVVTPTLEVAPSIVPSAGIEIRSPF
jgi:hypothetical protein